MEENQNLKIILLGNSNAGKTSLIIKFKTDRFSTDSVNTIGIDLNMEKNVKINNQLYDIAIWDTAGQEIYIKMVKFSAKDANTAMICFDLSESNSLENVATWIQLLREEGPQNIQIIIIGTKKDLPTKYTQEQLQQVQNAWKANFNYDFPMLLTSSKTGEGLKEAFQTAFELGAKAKQDSTIQQDYTSQIKQQPQNQKVIALISNTTTPKGSELNPKSESSCC
ncbi:unnamed protein product (macronuclear) [Paramecium tetraurelia]|uniref:Chromosome undetermined scaffold_1, whole genome shotgun sequence n=1 Tax=Paramecium tetraurelia TaxID=5888 RepID=Q6BG74_PARTE|nr:GTP-binding protein [Paramecium tetraurelia strain d4-2]XP_001423346.1 uncharacterized protein GSPATT00000383001 [Paramecium tetraurelia]CAH03346.1 GTP-binding protein, putative [Paramecium tetraurelia]CAI39288.1 rab_C76 [Paramecium tetraurelia]CAK55948.1 unnamed protein product [Paramecium tetraurelia]|eukprot:XP_001423346.1 hypothetical protein (macronuclear) [Paramecium tetraurelia strain d4-2]